MIHGQETEVIELRNRIVHLKWQPFDGEVDMDSLTYIDYSNIVGEIVTFATLMNKIGAMKADAGDVVRNAKLNLSVFEAKKANGYRITLAAGGSKAPTKDAVADAVMIDKEVIAEKRKYYKAIRQEEITDSLYWSIKDKGKRLDHATMGVVPEDFESKLLEGSVNNILITMHKKRF